MKTIKTYTFTWVDHIGRPHQGTIEANGSTNAFNSAMMDTRFKGCKILKTSFRRTDTAKGANRAAGLDSNGKQLNAKDFTWEKGNLLDGKSPSQWIQDQHTVNKIEAKAYKDFLKHLDKAIENLYLCHFENNGAVLSMPIKELYEAMKEHNPFK
jgi:hypothetical protein